MEKTRRTRIALIIAAAVAVVACAACAVQFLSPPINRLPYGNESLEEYLMAVKWRNWKPQYDENGEVWYYSVNSYDYGDWFFTATKTTEKKNYDISVSVIDRETESMATLRYSTDRSLPEDERIRYFNANGIFAEMAEQDEAEDGSKGVTMHTGSEILGLSYFYDTESAEGDLFWRIADADNAETSAVEFCSGYGTPLQNCTEQFVEATNKVAQLEVLLLVNITADTARDLIARAEQSADGDLASRLQTAADSIDFTDGGKLSAKTVERLVGYCTYAEQAHRAYEDVVTALEK
ncbi:MAG: hypothetical protein IJ449_01825 [Clostridia bacterium]|nr:hypothetical protein [Clostridia bacterium]